MNALIRGEYAGRHLFDLAAIESTKPDGTRVSGRYDNQGYFALYDGYTSDSGLPQRGWCQDRGDSLSRGDRAGLAEVDTAGDDSAHMPRRLNVEPASRQHGDYHDVVCGTAANSNAQEGGPKG